MVAPEEAARRIGRLGGVDLWHGAPPSWLRPDQHFSWRRIVSSLRSDAGALLLERVGQGKTWIALAAAAALSRRPVAIVPAILQDQWRAVARATGVPLVLSSHERTSRGSLPACDADLVIVDEAHRFRDAASRRTRTLAPWLVGRRTLLLTATPIVNGLKDLVTLLRLAFPDDLLRLDGGPLLSRLDTCASPPQALRRWMVRSMDRPAGIGASTTRVIAPGALECARGRQVVSDLARLRLSTSSTVRHLLIVHFLDAAASSDAAYRTALHRYRSLLLHSRDAGGASREMIRHMTGSTLDQLVFWELIPRGAGSTDLALEDLPLLDAMIQRPATEEWGLRQALASIDAGSITVCFARHRATAKALRDLSGARTAWVNGSEAGIGPHRHPRALVLSAFGPERRHWTARAHLPSLLIATEVAAEGLDLQAAGRIVHVDLPWTATRLDQREGRLLRIGQANPTVEVVRRLPPPVIEERLRQLAHIGRKRTVAATWLEGLEQPTSERSMIPDTRASCRSTFDADLVALTAREGSRHGILLLVRSSGAEWTTDGAAVGSLLARMPELPGHELLEVDAAAVARSAMQWAVRHLPRPDHAATRLVARLHGMARQAARRRDSTTVRQLDRLLRFALGSPTLGAGILLDALAGADDRQLLEVEVPQRPLAVTPSLSATVVVLFRSAAKPLQCPPCHAMTPFSSTLTAP